MNETCLECGIPIKKQEDRWSPRNFWCEKCVGLPKKAKLHCCECNREIANNNHTRFFFKEQDPAQPLAASTREFGTDHLDLNRPACLECCGLYKETWLDRQLKEAFRQLDEFIDIEESEK